VTGRSRRRGPALHERRGRRWPPWVLRGSAGVVCPCRELGTLSSVSRERTGRGGQTQMRPPGRAGVLGKRRAAPAPTPAQVDFKRTGHACAAAGCDGRMRDTVLDWGDALPEAKLAASERAAGAVGLALCLATSLQVASVCDVPLRTARRGARRYPNPEPKTRARGAGRAAAPQGRAARERPGRR